MHAVFRFEPTRVRSRPHRLALFATLLLFAFLPLAAFGQTSAPPVQEILTAPVTVDGATLFEVRGVSALPAPERARRIGERIENAAADSSLSPDMLRVVEQGDRSEFWLGDYRLFTVVDADAAVEEISRALLVETIRGRIALAIEAYRYDRSPGVLAIRAVYAVLVTLVTVGIFLGIRRAFAWFHALLDRRLARYIEQLEQQSLRLIQARHVWGAMHKLVTAGMFATLAFTAYVYLNFALSLFPWTRAIGHQLLTALLQPLYTIGNALWEAIPDLIMLVIVILAARYALRGIRTLFEAVDQGRITLRNFEPEWALPTHRLVRLMVIAFAVVLAYPLIPGSNTEAFKGVSIFAGILFSIGSTSLISNMVAGYSLTYRRTFKVGDRIRIGETIGEVAEMRLMVTQVRSPKNELVVIPNSVVLNSEVVNYSALAAKAGLILHTTVGIGYEVPWRQVEAMLLMAAERTPGLITDPPPFVLQKSLGDFAVNYELNVYCDDARPMMDLYSKLHRHIQDVFNEYGVQIMTPAYEGDPAEPKLVPKDKWFTAPAAPGTESPAAPTT